ncbi:uncharacterized protein [Lolium perenne]|uniref:uncharacterized protein n=1 Tax=Lolium perenne TaxID=4522 RepID=UPI0021EB2E2A|nr:uncharacterized protein LOC127327185 [Lolium perenne]
MVLIASASASDHRHRRAAKSSRPDAPAAPPTPTPAAKPSASAALHPFSFSWGAQRRLRCSKDGAPVYHSASPHTPSPDKEKPKPLPLQQDPARGCSSRPQRPRNLRPLRYAASRPEGAAGPHAALQSPKPAHAPPRKRGFAVALTPDEIAHDFAAIRRCAPRPAPAAAARRSSKKRTNRVQNAIDAMCPGLTLLNVDLDNYKIEERGQKK